MKNQITINSSNYDSFRYLEPYIRHCAHDYYCEEWELKKRKISDYEFLYFTEGEGAFTIEDRNYTVRKNDLLLFKPGLYHSGKSTRAPFGFLCMHFDIFIAKASNMGSCSWDLQYDAIPLKPVKYYKADIDFPEFVHIPEGSHTGALFNKIIIEKKKQEKGCKMMAGTHFTEMFLGLLRQRADSCLQQDYNGEIAGIIEFIKRNYATKIYLMDISHEVHLQPSYISGLFKRHTGVTISEYITIYRISKAKKLLLEKDGKISEVAYETGFYDVHHFSTTFKKYEGLSPGEYKKMNY